MDNTNSTTLTNKEFEYSASSATRKLNCGELLSDVTLVASDGRSIAAHTAILAISSDLFRKLLVDSSSTSPWIYCHDIEYDILKLIKEFIYHGELQVPNVYIEDFLKTGSELGVRGLVHMETGDNSDKDIIEEHTSKIMSNNT